MTHRVFGVTSFMVLRRFQWVECESNRLPKPKSGDRSRSLTRPGDSLEARSEEETANKFRQVAKRWSSPPTDRLRCKGGGLLIADRDHLPAMSRPQKSTGGDDESKPLSQGFIL